jgi:sugar phosphate isomerase/epimerase
MEFSICIDYIAKTMPMERAAQIVSAAGFTALDYTPPVQEDNWEEIMAQHMQFFADNNLHVHQTHAPFNRYNRCGDKLPLYIERTLQASVAMNASYMIAHGDEFNFKEMQYTPEKALEFNYELFAPFVEKASKAGLGVAFENVFEDANRPRFCSDVAELKALIQRFNSPTVSCCWDFGHAHVAYGKKQPEQLKEIAELVTCTHVHDNYYGKDLHLPPFLGEIDWVACMEQLKNVSYKGNLNFEFVYGAIPESLMEGYLKSFYDSAVILKNML